MFVVTFYSYKGGVGRTASLVNTAFRLAHLDKRVFIIDFDLEAPGIDEFRLSGDDRERPGLVEYITTFATKGEVPSLNDFVFQASSELVRRGSIFVMPAGKKSERAYQ